MTVEAPDAGGQRAIYWHRDLPPLGCEPLGEHVLEAASMRVKGDLAHRDELWGRCLDDLMARAADRLRQEMIRLGGDCVHVLEESIDSRHDDVTWEAFLHGRFRYLLLRRAPGPPEPLPKQDKRP